MHKVSLFGAVVVALVLSGGMKASPQPRDRILLVCPLSYPGHPSGTLSVNGQATGPFSVKLSSTGASRYLHLSGARKLN